LQQHVPVWSGSLVFSSLSLRHCQVYVSSAAHDQDHLSPSLCFVFALLLVCVLLLSGCMALWLYGLLVRGNAASSFPGRFASLLLVRSRRGCESSPALREREREREWQIDGARRRNPK